MIDSLLSGELYVEDTMIMPNLKRLIVSLAASAMIASLARAEVEKDVPFVPTPQLVVEEMLRLAAPKAGETLYDLGCGDGRIVITAAKRYNVKGIGVDIDPERIKESNENATKAGVSDRVKFLEKNLFEMDFSDADVLCMYLLPSVNVKLRPKILADMKSGARVVSHAFDMGDWKPDKTESVTASSNRTIYFWIVPARVEGASEVMLKSVDTEQKATLDLKQNYQHVSGTATIGGKQLRIEDGKLTGSRLEFTVDSKKYSCQMPVKDHKSKVE